MTIIVPYGDNQDTCKKSLHQNALAYCYPPMTAMYG